jgi:triacylglycerol lipase
MNYFEKCEEVDFQSFLDDEWKDYFFAECSRIAYQNKTVAMKAFKKIGFTTYKFCSVEGAQCHIAKNKEVTVIAFRGTEPKQWSDIKADLNAFKGKSRTEGRVHNGFKGELDKLWADVKLGLARNGDRDLYICGHSLGGAMATICASRLEKEVTELYTYGSPRVGGKEFVNNCLVEHYRFVNNNDMVAKVPFWIMGFRHHGYLTYINHYGNIRELTSWQKFKDQLRGRWAALRNFQMFDGIRDHDIDKYCSKLKAMVKIEPKFEE